MSIDAKQLKELVIYPCLEAIGLNTPAAVNLLLLTAATESHLGTYIRQVGVKGNIGAFGIYQMEERTYNALWDKVLLPNKLLLNKVLNFTGYCIKPPVNRLISDLYLATIMCRLHYYDIKSPLPKFDDIPALAKYWKDYYNSALGAGNVNEAVSNYQKYVVQK